MLWILALTLSFQTPAQDDPLARDMNALQGTWFAVALNNEDVQAPLAAIKQFKLEIKDQSMIFSAEGINDQKRMGFKIDPSKKPRHIDLVTLSGPKEGQVIPGIYKLEGDTLTICLPSKPNTEKKLDRPQSFDCPKGSGLGLFVVKKKVN